MITTPIEKNGAIGVRTHESPATSRALRPQHAWASEFARLTPALLCLTLCVVGAGCGDRITHDDVAGIRLTSPVVLTEPPLAGSVGFFGSDLAFGGTSDGNTVGFNDETHSTVEASGVTLMSVVALEHSGTAYLLVSSIDASENWRLDRFHDSTADGVPDQVTRTTLFVSSTPMYVTNMSVVDAGRILLLDRRCQDIRMARDTNSDGWVDSVNATPFAASASIAELLHTAHIESFLQTSGNLVVWARQVVPNMPERLAPEFASVTLTDTDDDDQSDLNSTEPAVDGGPYATTGLPYDGQDEIEVARIFITSPSVIEVWEVDADAVDIAMLGSVALGAGVASGTATLSSALQASDYVAIRYQGVTATQKLFDVVDSKPQVLGVAPGIIEPGAATTVTITGLNFAQSMTVKLIEDVETFVDVTSVQYVSATTAIVSVPAMSDLTVVRVAAFASGQPVEPNEYPTGRLSVCAAPP